VKSEEFAAALVQRRVLFVCCLLWSAVVNSSLFILHSSLSSVAAQNMHRYSLGFTLSERDFADTIDIEFEHHRILVPVEIEGKRYRFMFDTGCTQGIIFDSNRIPYLKEMGNVVSFDINNQSDTVHVVQLPAFRLGRLTIDGYLAIIGRAGPVSRGYDGIIGFDLLNKGLCCKIDVENKRLILTDRKKFFAQERGYEVKYKLSSFVPCVWVSPFVRHMDRAIFDTGFPGFYSMNRQSFQKHVYKSRQVAAQVEGRAIGQRTIGLHGVERADTVYFLALERLKWDNFSFRDLHIVTQEGNSHVGAALLDYGSVIINPFRKRIFLQPHTKIDEMTVGNKQFQMSIVPQDGRPAIGLIREESEAYRNGLRQGDIILKVNGRDIPSIAVFQQLHFKSGETYTYTVRHADGSVRDVKVKKE